MTIRRSITTIAALAGGLLASTAMPAAGAEPDDCLTVNFDHEPGVHVTSTKADFDDRSIRYSVVGSYVWFTWGHPGENFDSHEAPDTLSFDVSDPDVVSATACIDGSVELTRAQPDPVGGDPAPDVTPPSESPLTPVCELHRDVLEHYCTLPNRTLVIS